MAKSKKTYLDEYLENDDFRYDYKKDPLYAAMKKQYLSEAERTAKDVLGSYSQISGGGTPSSSAIAAASSAANLQKSKLSSALPQLYDMAWDMYQTELDNKRDKYNAVLDYDKFIYDTYGKEYDKYYEYDTPSNKEETATDYPVDNENNEDKVNLTPFKDGTGAEKSMDPSTFSMTEKLISNMVRAGNLHGAENYVSKFQASMSKSQLNRLKKLLSD